MAIGRSPEIILYRLRQCLFGAFRGDAGEPGGTGHFYRYPAGNLLDITQFRQYRAGGVGSRGEQSASARLALISIESVTLLAPEAIIPNPIRGRCKHCYTGLSGRPYPAR